jgi:hypothetical protein
LHDGCDTFEIVLSFFPVVNRFGVKVALLDNLAVVLLL